ncbi:MAG: hypothetical protein HZA50_06060 [Planctomycetes bacterium]|nr:hypothetical protein [Planctomycetota bacterium]
MRNSWRNKKSVLFDCANFQKDNDTLQIYRRQIRGLKGRQIVAPGEAKSAARRTKRNPGKNGPFNEVPDFRSRHRQTSQKFRQPRPKIFDEIFIRNGKSKTRVCPLRQQNYESAILFERGIREFCRFCRGANESLKTYSMTIYPQVALRTAIAVLSFTWGYDLPALRALNHGNTDPQSAGNWDSAVASPVAYVS